jgi:hypothetical protein
MASGFQQDTNQLQPSYYRVQIDMANPTYFPTTDLGNHQDGGCTPNAWDSFPAGSLPSTTAHAVSRARGNLRFKQVVNQLSGLADCQILDISITEANVDAQATGLAFTVKFDRDEFIPLTGTKRGTVAVGNDAAGNPMTTISEVIANTVAAGLYNGTTELGRVYNPVTSEGTDQGVTANANATLAQILGKVSVMPISETGLTS